MACCRAVELAAWIHGNELMKEQPDTNSAKLFQTPCRRRGSNVKVVSAEPDSKIWVECFLNNQKPESLVRWLTAALASFSKPELRNRIPIETAPALSPKTVTYDQPVNFDKWYAKPTDFAFVTTKTCNVGLYPLEGRDLILKAKIKRIIGRRFNACWKTERSQPIVETDKDDGGSLRWSQCIYNI